MTGLGLNPYSVALAEVRLGAHSRPEPDLARGPKGATTGLMDRSNNIVIR